jgi:uncharacterized protein with HEPN domain
MLDAVADIELAVAGTDFGGFADDRVRQNAVLWSFSVMGEAAKHVPEAIREAHPEVPWRLARAMRNFLVHQYESVDLSIVWEAVVNDLPELKRELEAVLRDAEGGG